MGTFEFDMRKLSAPRIEDAFVEFLHGLEFQKKGPEGNTVVVDKTHPEWLDMVSNIGILEMVHPGTGFSQKIRVGVKNGQIELSNF